MEHHQDERELKRDGGEEGSDVACAGLSNPVVLFQRSVHLFGVEEEKSEGEDGDDDQLDETDKLGCLKILK